MFIYNPDPGENINTVARTMETSIKTESGNPKFMARSKSQTEGSEAPWMQGHQGKPGRVALGD